MNNNKLIDLINEGIISVADLAGSTKIIEYSELALQGVEACKKTISFPLGETNIKWSGSWNSHDSCPEGWAEIKFPSLITFHNESPIPFETFDLLNPKDIFLALTTDSHLSTLVSEFIYDQIYKAKKR